MLPNSVSERTRFRKMTFVQNLLQMDDVTFSFLQIFVGTGLVLALASALVTPRAPHKRPASQDAGGRSQFIKFAVQSGKSIVEFVGNTRISPNDVTLIGMALVIFNCAVFAISKNTFWFGTGLIAALLFDTLDGLVARYQGTSSLVGGYLDAVIDRYQEIVVYFTIGWVLDQWPIALLILSAAMLTSYNKARVALELQTSNKAWPDLLEKPLRMVILCVALIGAPIVPWLLPAGLWMLVVMTHFTALQRFARARFLLSDEDRARRSRVAS